MEYSIGNRNPLNIVTNQPIRKTSNKPNLVQHLTRSNPIQISSGLKILNKRIQSDDTLSYQPLVTISDNDDSDEDDFVSPIYKLTKYELREEVKAFHQNDDSTGNA